MENTELKAIEATLADNRKLIVDFISKHEAEVKDAGKASEETKNALDKLTTKATELSDRMATMEQKQTQHFDGEEQKSPGDLLVESTDFKAFMARGGRGSARIELKTAIVNARPSMDAPLVAGHRLDRVVAAPDRALRLRDVLPVGQTESNIVFFPKENTFTNSAAVVVGGSPTIGSGAGAENVTKPESAITFTSGSAEVKTIAHFIPVSKQALDDSTFLRSYVDSRLLYGVKYTEDDALLNHDGTLGKWTGIWSSRTAYSQSSPITAGSRLDKLRRAIAQGHVANYSPNVIILHPTDFAEIELTKGSTNDHYVYANPTGSVPPQIWGLPVVQTTAQTVGRFVVMDRNAVQIWDRQSVSVSISYEDSTNFQKNMATLLAEERLAFAVYLAGGIIGGTF